MNIEAAKKGCSFPGCRGSLLARGLCGGHYHQWRNGYDLKPLRIRSAFTECQFPGCGRKINSHGLCSGHDRQRVDGKKLRPLRLRRSGAAVCSFPGCGRPHESHGYCSAHRKQVLAGKKLMPIRRRTAGAVCEVDGCQDKIRSRGLCSKHYHKWLRKNNSCYAIGKNLRRRIYGALRPNKKTVGSMDLVGCTLPRLRAHLESLFAPGMSWDNYGKWHIDHIMPCSSFDLLDPAQQRECFHYTNLQPLWAEDNIRKRDKTPEQWAEYLEGSKK